MLQEWEDREPIRRLHPVVEWSAVIVGGLFVAVNAIAVSMSLWSFGKTVFSWLR